MEKIVTIRKEGGSKVITITDFVPKDWQYIKIIATNKKDNSVTLKLEKVV